MTGRGRWLWEASLLLLMGVGPARGEMRFPPPEFESGYSLPQMVQAPPPSPWLDYLDAGVLLASLLLAGYLALRWRSRRALLGLGIFGLLYFGFWRAGCVCAIGSIQNVALAVFDPGYALPWTVGIFFLAPILAALWVGRVFCSGVCPFGALQDLVLVKPVHLPGWAEEGLGVLPYAYLSLAVVLAAGGGEFVICRYDPFVGFFRFAGPATMILLGVGLLVLGLFIGRPYCRFLCPYGALLRLASRLSWRSVRIAPQACIHCKLCDSSCPYGAIHRPMSPPTRLQVPAIKRRVARILLLTPALMLLGAALGYGLAPALARTHPTIDLAQKVHAFELAQAQANGPLTPGDEVAAFIKTGRTSAQLYDHALAVRTRFLILAVGAGAFLGLVLAGKLLRLARQAGRHEYEADRAGCVACGRCFEHCPKELERRGTILPAQITVETRPAHA